MISIQLHPSNLLWSFISTAHILVILLISHSAVKAQTTDIQGIEQHVQLGKNQNMYLIIRPSLKQGSLEKMAHEFGKRGVNISYSNVKYNSDNLLTSIHIQVIIGDCQSTGGKCYRWKEEAYNDGLPLDHDKPLIFYIYQKDQKVEFAGTSFGYPSDLPAREIRGMKNMTGSLVGNFMGG